METKSTHPPVAVQTSPPTTIQPADASTPPLPATEDEATRKEKKFRRHLHLFSYEKLGSGESSSSDLKKDSFWSSDRRISLGSLASSVSNYVFNQSKRSNDRDIDFKMNPDDKCAFRPVSLPVRRDFRYYPSSDSKKKVATADGDSVLSLDSGLDSLESLSSDLKKASFRSSDRRCVSSKERQCSYQHDIDFKKNQDDKSSFRSVSLSDWLNFGKSLFSHPLKKVATADRDSVLSLDSGISLERKVSSGSSCESGKKEKEKTTPPNTQELDVGSSAGIET